MASILPVLVILLVLVILERDKGEGEREEKKRNRWCHIIDRKFFLYIHGKQQKCA